MRIATTIAGEILHTSIQFFLERGYVETRFYDIARCARVTEGAVYRLFRNKEGLLEQTLRCKLIGSFDPGRLPHPVEYLGGHFDLQALEDAVRKDMESIFSIRNQPL